MKIYILVLVFLCFSIGIIYAQPEIVDAKPPVSTYSIPSAMKLCGEIIPLDRPDIRERFDREFYYTLDREGQLVLYIKRANRCFAVIEPILKELNVPDDLKYLAVAESGLLFRAYSPAGAAGYWQFVKGTAKRYGLRVDRYIDERRDLERSTRAAIMYLSELREQFGSWMLALAAYNWGENKIEKAVEEQGTSDYFGLYVPDETDRFIFRIAILKLIIGNPQGYDIYTPHEDLYTPSKKTVVSVTSERWFSIDVLATCAGIHPRAFRFMNEWMISNTLPPGTYDFSVPPSHALGFADCVRTDLSSVREITHIVRRGESLTIIADRYGVTIQQIEQWNGISRWRAIHPGQKLIILSP